MADAQRFTGSLSLGNETIGVSFTAEISETGEVRPQFDPIPLTRETAFLMMHWESEDFNLSGTSDQSMSFESTQVSIESMGTPFDDAGRRYELGVVCREARYFSTGHENLGP